MGMRLYPDLSRPRARTVAGDVAVLLAVVLFAWLGTVVHGAVEELVPISQGVQDAGRSVEGALNKAGDTVGGAPIVGGEVKDALKDAARGTGGEAVQAGRQGEQSTRDLADLFGWLTFLIPAVLLLSRFVPPRIAQIQRLTAAHAVLSAHADADPERRRLLAQRAAFGLPYATLLRHTKDPLGDLLNDRLDPLVAAIRDDAGLSPRGSSGRPAGRAATRSPA